MAGKENMSKLSEKQNEVWERTVRLMHESSYTICLNLCKNSRKYLDEGEVYMLMRSFLRGNVCVFKWAGSVARLLAFKSQFSCIRATRPPEVTYLLLCVSVSSPIKYSVCQLFILRMVSFGQ